MGAGKHCAAWTSPFWAGTSPWDPCISSPSPTSLARWRQRGWAGLEAAGSGCATYSGTCKTEALCAQGASSWQPGLQTPLQKARCGLSRGPGGPSQRRQHHPERRGGPAGQLRALCAASLGGHPPNLPHTNNLVLMDKISLRILMRLLLETDSSSED